MTSYALAPRWRRVTSGSGFHTLILLAGLSVLAPILAWAPVKWAAFGLSGVGLLLATLVQPSVGLVVLAFLIPIGGLVPLPVPGVNGVDLLFAVVLAAWLAQGIARRRIIFRPPTLFWLLTLLAWVAALSLTQAQSWRDGLPELLKWVEFAGVYLVATQVLDRRGGRWVIGALLAAGLGQVVLGAYQFVRQVGPPAFILAGRFMRAYGSFQQPNPYAGYLGYLTPVAASLAVAGFGQWWRERKRLDLGLGAGFGAVALLLAAGIGMSWSRGGWLALGVALAAVLALRSRRAAMISVALGVVLATFIVLTGTGWLPSSVAARVDDLGSYFVGPDPAHTEITDANFAVLERLAHWQAGLSMFGDHPWLGVGIGNYADAYAHYALSHWYVPLGHAHNIYINFLAETGVLGTGAFLAFWLGAFLLTWRSVGRTLGYQSALALGVLGTLVYLSVHNLFDNLFVQHMQLQLALLLGCVVVSERTKALF